MKYNFMNINGVDVMYTDDEIEFDRMVQERIHKCQISLDKYNKEKNKLYDDLMFEISRTPKPPFTAEESTMTDPLSTLNKAQREAVRDKIMLACQKGFQMMAGESSKPIAYALMPEPEPLMVPLEDIEPLIRAIDLSCGNYSMCIYDALKVFESKHSDKLAALKGGE